MELPRLKAVYEKFKGRGFQVVAVERMKDSAGATKFIRENNLPYRFVENGGSKAEFVQSLFGIYLFPTSYLVDKSNRIVRVYVGFDEGDEKEYEQQIQELLDAPSSH